MQKEVTHKTLDAAFHFSFPSHLCLDSVDEGSHTHSKVSDFLMGRITADVLDHESSMFGSTKWRELRCKLLAQFKEEAKSTGKALVSGHDASEDTD